MALVNKIYPSFKKALLVSTLLGVSVSCLYASDPVDCEITLKGTSTQQSQNMIIQIESEENPQEVILDDLKSVESAENKSIFQCASIFSVPQEVWPNVFFFIPYKDRLEISSSSRAFCTVGRQALMSLDLRHLERREWKGGPRAGTFDTYLLNNIFWTMGSDHLESLSGNLEHTLSCFRSFFEKKTFLKTHFSQCGKIVDSFLGTLINTDSDKQKIGFKLLRDYALKNPDSPEASHLHFMAYVKNDKKNLNITDRMSTVLTSNLVERFHSAKMLRLRIGKVSAQKSLPLWEEVLQYSLGPQWRDDLKNTAKAYFDSANLSMDSDRELNYFRRSAQLYDAYFTYHEPGLGVDNINCAALAHSHIVQMSDCPLEQAQSLELSVQLYEMSLLRQGEEAKTKTIKNALKANLQMGLGAFDQKQKIPFLRRSAQLYDQLVVKLGDDTYFQIFKMAKTCHEQIAQATQDPFQKVLSLKRAFQLQEQALDISRDYGRGAEEEILLSQLREEIDLHMGELQKDIDFYVEKACVLDQMLDMDAARSPDFFRNAALVYEITGDKARAKKLNKAAIYLEQEKHKQVPVSDSPSEIFWKLVEASAKAF